MGSRGSAMYEGECVSERASDGSPFLQAAEAAVTDGGASRDCVQSSAPTASGEELLQRVEENHQELHSAIQQLNTKEEKPCALLAAWLKEDEQENEALRQEVRHLEEALEEEEACHYQRKKEAETPETVLLEVVEAQLERDVLARRRGFCCWLQTLLLLLVGLELVVGFAVAAAVLHASCYHPGLFCRLLPPVLPEEAYADLAYALGKILPAVSEGRLPF
ncbi:uncharacterized protein [Haliaeetus albicilla]|uniref:uncharacterized protein n=1 Tax=Haliaeetus albicilla TaxID=8969 RepID=UPI0037E90148